MAEIIRMPGSGEKQPKAVKSDEIMDEVERLLGDHRIALIYRDRILTMRTRRYELKAPAKPVPVEILHTLLGIELKIGRRRLLCPDLATARYLMVFARLGLEAIAVPYDITQISCLADDLESSWYRMLTLCEHLTAGRSERLRNRVQIHLVARERTEITELGAGTLMPQFNQVTRQRRTS